jgi:hypothetical protein
MTDKTDETDDVTHRLTVNDDAVATYREKLASLFGHDEPAQAASVSGIGADSVRTDEWHIPYADEVEVYLTHDDTEYHVVERDGELGLEVTEGDE